MCLSGSFLRPTAKGFVGKLTVQCCCSWVLWVKKKHTHAHTTIIVKVCVWSDQPRKAGRVPRRIESNTKPPNKKYWELLASLGLSVDYLTAQIRTDFHWNIHLARKTVCLLSFNSFPLSSHLRHTGIPLKVPLRCLNPGGGGDAPREPSSCLL